MKESRVERVIQNMGRYGLSQLIISDPGFNLLSFRDWL